MKNLVIQVMIGAPGYAYNNIETPKEFEDYCMPSVKRYCEKHGYDYKLITEFPKDHDPRWFNFNTKPDSFNYRQGGKQKGSTLVRYLNMYNENYDNVISLDCDIYIPEIAEPLPEIKGHVGVQDLGKGWETFRSSYELPEDTFVNGGVQMVNKEAGKMIYDFMVHVVDNQIMPPLGYKSDQSYMNYWRSENHDKAFLLGTEWNYMPGPWYKTIDVNNKNFIHYAGQFGRDYLREHIKKGIVK